MTLKLLDTFAGIGGFSYAAERLVGGFKTTQFIEIEPFCQKILNKHWPEVPIHDDITTFTAEPFQYDVICGGFPCQDISVAGQGKGITETSRSGLWFQLIKTIRMVRPKYFVLENVSAIFNNGLGIVLRDIYETGLYECEWCCIPSSFVGACHQRDRWWLIAYPIGFQSRSESKIQTGRDSSSCSNRSGDVTDSDNNGSSSTKESRSIEKTDGEFEERQNATGNSERSSESKDSRNIQLSITDTKGSKGNEYEIERGDGKTRIQKVSRNRDRSENPYAWRSTEHRLNPNWRQYVSEPCLRRGDDGLSDRTHRLTALGNSVTPQVAAIPLQRVIDLEKNYQLKK